MIKISISSSSLDLFWNGNPTSYHPLLTSIHLHNAIKFTYTPIICYSTFSFLISQNVPITQTTKAILHLLTLNIHIIVETLHWYVNEGIEGNKWNQIVVKKKKSLSYYKLWWKYLFHVSPGRQNCAEKTSLGKHYSRESENEFEPSKRVTSLVLLVYRK